MGFQFSFPTANDSIAIIGLGYVGIPLLLEILKTSSKRKIVGFDIDKQKIKSISEAKTLEQYGYKSNISEYVKDNDLELLSESSELSKCKIFVVTVPTPIDHYKSPDLKALISASKTIGEAVANSEIEDNKFFVVIYESTVYPGVTEDICRTHLLDRANKKGGMIKIGYSPERLNPGDTRNTLSNIVKVVSGEDKETTQWVNDFYKRFIKASIFVAKNIKTAEAAKVIENTQRDLNISLVNELAIICSRIGIDTNDVLDAASTKWNFMDVRPGLVGGHCIGVDPYYLAYKAKSLGLHSRVILSGRSVNDGMPGWIARKAVKSVVKMKGPSKIINCLIMGMTFKENCDDLRNSKSIELYNCLRTYGVITNLTDPILEISNRKIPNDLCNIQDCVGWDQTVDSCYDLIILAVAHNEYRRIKVEDLMMRSSSTTVFYDLKNVFPRELPNLMRL